MQDSLSTSLKIVTNRVIHIIHREKLTILTMSYLRRAINSIIRDL